MSNINDFVITGGGFFNPDDRVLKQYTGTDTHVVIPDGVTNLWASAFQNNAQLIEITIPESVTRIDDKAFSDCYQLEKVIILGEGLRSIGKACFKNCTALKDIRLPCSIQEIPANLFEGCTSLLKVLDNCTLAGDVLLECDPGWKGYDFFVPEGVRMISSWVFRDQWGRPTDSARRIQSIQIPEGVEYVGTEAFSKMDSLQTVSFPGSLRVLGRSALSFLPLLQRADLSHTRLETLNEWMFACNHKMKEVLLPQGLKRIGDAAFSSCDSLRKVALPASLEELGTGGDYSSSGVFNASGIQQLEIPEGITEINGSTFCGCEALCGITLPQSLTTIGDRAFLGCSKLSSIAIPACVTAIGEDAFSHCANLGRPALPETLAAQTDEDYWNRIGFGDENGCVIKDGVLVKYVGPTDFVTVSEGVTEIPENTLKISGQLHKYPEKYCLPQSLKVIHEQRFGHYGEQVTLPTGYLQTQNALPAKYTYILLNGSWREQAVTKDYAALYLFQKGKDLVKLCEVKLINAPEAATKCFVELLSNDCKSAHIVKAAEFVVENKGSLSPELIAQLYEIAVTKKAKKAVDLLKPIAGVEDTTPKAKKASTHPIEDFCKEHYEEHFLDKTAKKAGLSKKSFEGVLYKISGKKVPAFVVKCAVIPYIEQMEERPKHISGYKTDHFPVRFVENADKVAAEFDSETFLQALEKIASLNSMGYSKPQCLIPLCRYGNENHIKELISKMRQWENWNTCGSSGRSAIIVARGAIMLNESREAMLYIEKCKKLYTYAAMRGIDEDVLRDTKLAEFGLDTNGCKFLDLGNTTIDASVGQDLSICLYDTKAQKIVKSLPKKGADADKYAAASAVLSDLKKNLKKVVKSRNDILFERFLDGKTQKAASWIASYTKNPVLHRVAELIVWNQKKNTFIMTKTGTIDCNGNTYSVDTSVPVGVAHPKDMTKAELAAWQKYFTSNGLKQPFEQIWEPVVDSKSIQTDRYKGCMIPFFRFKGRERHGIFIQDWDFHNQIDISFEGCDANVERIDWRRHDIGMDDRFEITSFSIGRSLTRKVNHIVAYLDRITVYGRILNDDVSVVGMLPMFTLAQIMEFINAATENKCTNVLAVLLDYKNRTFIDFDPMEEFSLDL